MKTIEEIRKEILGEEKPGMGSIKEASADQVSSLLKKLESAMQQSKLAQVLTFPSKPTPVAEQKPAVEDSKPQPIVAEEPKVAGKEPSPPAKKEEAKIEKVAINESAIAKILSLGELQNFLNQHHLDKEAAYRRKGAATAKALKSSLTRRRGRKSLMRKYAELMHLDPVVKLAALEAYRPMAVRRALSGLKRIAKTSVGSAPRS